MCPWLPNPFVVGTITKLCAAKTVKFALRTICPLICYNYGLNFHKFGGQNNKSLTKKKNSKNAISEFEIENIEVYGTRVHNLKDIDVFIPRNKFVVITGVSGSGKSSLAFDTIYAEGQRRYMESFSAYARQFVGGFERPDVDKINGLSPVISIEQKTTSRNPRSTVGTVTEIYDFYRLLFARIGEAYSYNTGKRMIQFSEEQIKKYIFDNFTNKKIVILAPVVKGRKGHYRELFQQIRKQGYLKVRIDGEIKEVVPKMQVDRYKIHDIEIVIDRLAVKDDAHIRLAASMDAALKAGNGLLMVMEHNSDQVMTFSKNLMDAETGLSYDLPSPNTFSFNSPYGYCPACRGLGFILKVDPALIIPDPNLSINKKGLAPLGDVKETYSFKKIQALAKKYKFKLSTPIKDIPKKALNVLLYGTEIEGEVVEVKFGTKQWYDLEFEGLSNTLRRAYAESGSESLRRWGESYMTQTPCPTCEGARLKVESLHFKLDGKNISEVAQMDINEMYDWTVKLNKKLDKRQLQIATELLKEIRTRIKFLLDVGLDYLALDRPAKTLSGGESQRIRLATQIGSQLVGITYILDEPSIGLHQRDNHRLIESLRELCDVGNTVLVVEHDKDIMLASDYIIDIGPGAGEMGGKIVGEAPPKDFLKLKTNTASFLRDKELIAVPKERRKGNGDKIKLKNCEGNNLKKVSVEFPLGTFICVTGVSGSGKSTLINETLYPVLKHHVYNKKKQISHAKTKPLKYGKIEGLDLIDKVIEIDQSPIGRTPRSNPATYIGVFTEIRNIYSLLPESKIRGYKTGRFSFNVKGGRCETCKGGGMRVIEMNFLPDVFVECETCQGRRYNRETLEIRYKGKSISDVLNMTVNDAVDFFEAIPKIKRKVKTLQDVGLGYITLGQSAVTLSGGEAQRVKLSSELSKIATGKTIYILDEPTTGLHFSDVKMLLAVLQQLVDKGNTIIVIEHNLDVIKVADYIIDIGPEGGKGGGTVVAYGTPEKVAKNKKSHTGRFLKKELE